MSAMTATVEKRKDKRYLMRDLMVYMRDSKEELGKVINMSLSGLLIAHDTSMAVDSVFKIKIPVAHTKHELSDFDADVMVKWFRQNDMSGLFGFGLEFLDNTEEQRTTIQEMINAFAENGA